LEEDMFFNDERQYMKYRFFYVACLLVYMVVCGCASSKMSLQDRSGEWIARPLSELEQEMKSADSYASKIGWKETTYPLANGDFVYVEPIGTDCSLHWEVNQSGIIIGCQVKGRGCEQSTGSSDEGSIVHTNIR
jgi:hypothetical protein